MGDCGNKFVNKYFPQSKVTHGRLEISSFKQGMEETLSQAWERFKGLLKKTPVHGSDKTTIVLAYLGGLNMQSKMMLDASARGDFKQKTEDEAYDLIESMTANGQEAYSERGTSTQ